jgi:hypothetical protein
VASRADSSDQATAHSAACVTSPPNLTDGTEWFVPMPGRDGRRAVQVGEHLAVDHPLVLAYPERFAPSAEPVDCWPVGVADAETRKHQQAEQLRLAAHLARKVTPACARCGAESTDAVVVFDMPTQLDLLSSLSALDDYDPDSWAERWRIEARYAAMARTVKAQEDELRLAEAAWRAEHPRCPEGTPPLEEPQVPERPAFHYRLPAVRTLG